MASKLFSFLSDGLLKYEDRLCFVMQIRERENERESSELHSWKMVKEDIGRMDGWMKQALEREVQLQAE